MTVLALRRDLGSAAALRAKANQQRHLIRAETGVQAAGRSIENAMQKEPILTGEKKCQPD
jgi:hypothetical protein